MLHVQIIMYIALYSVSVSNCWISRWIQPPEQRPLNFQQRSQKKSSFLFCLFVLQKDVYSFLQCSRTTFAVHIVYYHMLMKILVVGTQNSNKVWKITPNWQGSPFFSSNIVLYFIMYVILNEFIRTHTHTQRNI